MLHRITSSTIADLMYLRIRDIEESPCAKIDSTRRSTKNVIDHMWAIMHDVERESVVDIDAMSASLAVRASTAAEWAEREAAAETYAVITAAAHA